MIKVSIIVPICNVEKYLDKCLESILNQTLKEIEIICIDDGSTDESKEITQKYVDIDSRFQLHAKSNAGYGHTMNLGLSIASGEYVGIIESDDFIESSMFEKLYVKAKEGNYELVKGDHFLYWSDPEHFFPSGSLDHKNVFDIVPSIWSAIYKRSFLENNNIKFLETSGASFQDTSFNFKVWSCVNNYYLYRYCFVYYRQDNMNSSVKSNSKVFNICDEFEEIERFLTEKNKDLIRRRALCYLWNYRRLGKEGRDQFYGVLKSACQSLFKHENYLKVGFTMKQLLILWLSAYMPYVFKLIINLADEKE